MYQPALSRVHILAALAAASLFCVFPAATSSEGVVTDAGTDTSASSSEGGSSEAPSTTETGPSVQPYEAEYEARSSGLRARAHRSLSKLEDHRYQLENNIRLTVMGATVSTLTEQSQFLLEREGLTPLSYRYEQTGVRRRLETLDFDWERQQVDSVEGSERWQLPLEAGTMDKLSYFALMRQDLQEREGTSGCGHDHEGELSYQVIDGDEVEEHRYRVVDREALVTPLGKLNTVRLERVREPGSSRSTTLWLAPEWDYLLVRLEQSSSSGRETELILEQARVGGVEVSGN